MNLNHKNSKKQGDAGLGIAIGWFAANGYTVCLPLTDSQQYDLIIDDNITLSRVQVKTTRHKGPRGRFILSLRTSGGNRTGTGKSKKFDPSEVEILFAIDADGNKYLIPSLKVRGKSSIDLSEYYYQFIVT